MSANVNSQGKPKVGLIVLGVAAILAIGFLISQMGQKGPQVEDSAPLEAKLTGEAPPGNQPVSPEEQLGK